MPRLFTGLEIPAKVQQSLSLLRGGLPGARWIDPENYHITLRFIGDIDDRMAHEIASMLDGMRRRSFDVRFGGLKSFGGRKPRAIVVAVEPVQPLIVEVAHHGEDRGHPLIRAKARARHHHRPCLGIPHSGNAAHRFHQRVAYAVDGSRQAQLE